VDFTLSEEQRQIRDAIGRLLADHYDLQARRTHAACAEGFSREMWAAYAQQGLLGVPFPESMGGLGGGAVEVMLIMEAFGRALALEPYLATVILGGGLLRQAARTEQQALISRICAGELLLAVATSEPHASADPFDIATRARAANGGWVIDGEKSLVLHGGSADRIIVPARISGVRDAPEGIRLFLLEPGTPGLSKRAYPMQDGMRAADISLRGVRADPQSVLDAAGEGGPLLARVIDEAIAALCAEAVGAMSALQELTLEYLKTRRQFGVPIGSFQALQHRAVEMYIVLEQARSMALYAALSTGEHRVAQRRRAVSTAKAHIGRAARYIGQEAIQLHGALGMTEDYAAGQYFKRLTMIDVSLGSHHQHIGELARAGETSPEQDAR
jgi:alkylation response protein AidB-like acyl-CoA dehydrogenase